jgi:hypothetical protein
MHDRGAEATEPLVQPGQTHRIVEVDGEFGYLVQQRLLVVSPEASL